MNFIEAVKLLDHKNKNLFIINKNVRRGKNILYIRSEESDFSLVASPDLNDDYDYDYKPTKNDILSDNWETYIYKPEEKLHNFQEAIKALKEGKAIKRKSSESTRMYNGILTPLFDIEDIEAEDWIIK